MCVCVYGNGAHDSYIENIVIMYRVFLNLSKFDFPERD